MPVSGAAMAKRVDHYIRQYGQSVTLYRPTTSVVSDRIKVGPQALVAATTAMLQFGPAARDQASAIGVNPNQAAQAFFLSTAAAMVHERGVLVDRAGQPWLIHSIGNAQALDSSTVGVSALLERLTTKPAGVA